MKVEDSPYGFYGSSPIEKLKRPNGVNNAEGLLEAFDLSFLDLLTSTTELPRQSTAQVDTAQVAQKNQPKAVEKPEETTAKPKLSLVRDVDTCKSASNAAEDAVTRVAKDMTLFSDDLTATDLQYLKQVVIPGLPILMGSVPFESIFPPDGSGNISYQGFEVSPKLAELIEKGYKTGQPVRVELDPHSAVVLKIRNGQVSAEFVSADKTAAMVLQQELDQLRNRMLSRNLPVGTLEYKYRDPAQPQPRQQDNDEHTE
jgi:hypothetical protein